MKKFTKVVVGFLLVLVLAGCSGTTSNDELLTFMSTNSPSVPTSEESAAIREELDTMIVNGEDVTNFDTSRITNMSELFKDNTTFNQDLSGWDVSSVTNYSDFNTSSGLADSKCPIWN